MQDSGMRLQKFVCLKILPANDTYCLVLDREEGFRALFKGGPARVIRSSPQFGFTLLG